MLLSRESYRTRWEARQRLYAKARAAATKAAPKTKPIDHDKLDRQMHRLELIAIDRHIAATKRALGETGQAAPRVGFGAGADYKAQELKAELAALATLRAELIADHAAPITTHRDGRDLSDTDRARRRLRAKELADQFAFAAAKAAAEADHRRARNLRHDALRSRFVAEHEMRLRPSLRGYSHR